MPAMSDAAGETFAEFKDSFFYGTRPDLSFKFLEHMPSDEAAEFLRVLLQKVGETLDDGDAGRLVRHVVAGQVAGYAHRDARSDAWSYGDGPFVSAPPSLRDARVALFTSSGHFVEGDDPRHLGVTNMGRQESLDRIGEFLRTAPVLSEIPVDTAADRLRVCHGGYDIRGVLADPEVAFPLGVLRSLVADGVIGELAPTAYSFVGATSQKRLLKECAPEWVERLRADDVDVVLLVPV